ncbi:hypothetical protein Zm00014a_040729, partial [Zea mays]
IRRLWLADTPSVETNCIRVPAILFNKPAICINSKVIAT